MQSILFKITKNEAITYNKSCIFFFHHLVQFWRVTFLLSSEIPTSFLKTASTSISLRIATQSRNYLFVAVPKIVQNLHCLPCSQACVRYFGFEIVSKDTKHIKKKDHFCVASEQYWVKFENSINWKLLVPTGWVGPQKLGKSTSKTHLDRTYSGIVHQTICSQTYKTCKKLIC